MLRECLSAELGAAGSSGLWWAAVRTLLIGASPVRAVLLYRLGSRLYEGGHRKLASLFFRRLERGYGCYIGRRTVIGPGLKLPHPTGIVIGDGATIGNNCTIYQQATIGGKNTGDAETGAYPTIEDDVVIFAGARVLGKITVREGATIGANSVVTRDVAANTVVAGAPASPV